jgi:hypothetical protein
MRRLSSMPGFKLNRTQFGHFSNHIKTTKLYQSALSTRERITIISAMPG